MENPNITKDTPLAEVKKIGMKCNQCGKCCSFGSGFVLESEIPKIAAFLKTDAKTFKKEYLEPEEIFATTVFKFKTKKAGKPYGPCMFLEDNKCKIHKVKPLHCMICNCAEGDDLHVWFMVNYCLNKYDPESIRQYVSYIDTGGRVIPGAELEKVFPDKKLLKEILEYKRIR